MKVGIILSLLEFLLLLIFHNCFIQQQHANYINKNIIKSNNIIRTLTLLKNDINFNNDNNYEKEEDVDENRFIKRPLKQLKLYFDCDEIDGEEISEFLFEIGVLSVSVEVQSEKKGVLNDEKKWADLVKIKSWATAMLRANFPESFESDTLKEIILTAYPDANIEMEVCDIEDTDWVTQVQSSWQPQIIDDLTIRFPWHDPSETKTKMELVLEGGAAFGTGNS